MKTFIVTSTALLAPIPDEMYPEYNSGYHKETVMEIIHAETEDEVYRMYDDGERFENVRVNEVLDSVIIKCVNMHDALIDGLKKSLKWYKM